MSDIAATTVHEAYAFACMRCGYGWEQDYEIEHHVDGSGNPFVTYKADGQQVPSPLSTPTCANCGGHVVRIMRAGRVSIVQQLLSGQRTTRPKETREEEAAGEMAVEAVRAPGPAAHHWQLSDLLRHFHRH